MQAVGALHHHHVIVPPGGIDQLSEVLAANELTEIAGVGGACLQFGLDLGDSADDRRDLLAELSGDFAVACARILDGVVQEPCRDDPVLLQMVGKNLRHGNRVREEVIA